MEDFDLDDQFGDYPSFERSSGGPSCLTVAVVVLIVGAVISLLSEWIWKALAGAAIAWGFILLFVVPVVGVVALVVSGVVNFSEWRRRRAERKGKKG